MKKEVEALGCFSSSFLSFLLRRSVLPHRRVGKRESDEGVRVTEGARFGSLDNATHSETLTATPSEMLQPGICCFLSSVFILLVPPPADGQTATGRGGGGGVERVQVMFTPTICKVRCSQEGCVNYCERGNVTTLYSSSDGGGEGRRKGSRGPGFRVCES